MRADTRTLLNRLSVKSFVYEDFADTLSDIELWPIFEITLDDLRVVGNYAIPTHRDEFLSDPLGGKGLVESCTGAQASGLPTSQPAPLSVVTAGGMFHNYATTTRTPELAAHPTGDRGVSVRAILGRLSQGVE